MPFDIPTIAGGGVLATGLGFFVKLGTEAVIRALTWRRSQGENGNGNGGYEKAKDMAVIVERLTNLAEDHKAAQEGWATDRAQTLEVLRSMERHERVVGETLQTLVLTAEGVASRSDAAHESLALLLRRTEGAEEAFSRVNKRRPRTPRRGQGRSR